MSQCNSNIPTTVKMSVSQVSDMTSDKEPLEIESVIKLEVNEDKLPKPQNIYETDEDSKEDALNEDEVYEQVPLRKQRIYNEMVEFQTELRKPGLAGSLCRIIHMQQEKLNQPMLSEVA